MGYESDINALIETLEGNQENYLDAVGQVLRKQAVLLAPIGELYGGKLRQDIDYGLVEDGKDKGVAVGNNLDYALYVNKGTGVYAEGGNGRKSEWTYFDPKTNRYYKTDGQKPQPYLRQSLDKQKGTIASLTKMLGEV